MKVKVKKLYPDAQLPTYATDGSAAFDIYAYQHECAIDGNEPITLTPNSVARFETGVSFEIPAGFVLLVFSRSGHGFNNNVRLSNSVGVIDSDFRGQIMVKLHNEGWDEFTIKPGERIAQGIIMPYPKVEFEEVDELSETQCGTGGFGSTGK